MVNRIYNFVKFNLLLSIDIYTCDRRSKVRLLQILALYCWGVLIFKSDLCFVLTDILVSFSKGWVLVFCVYLYAFKNKQKYNDENF